MPQLRRPIAGIPLLFDPISSTKVFFKYFGFPKSQDSADGIATGYRLDEGGVGDQAPIG
jgi:hypothetical protein